MLLALALLMEMELKEVEVQSEPKSLSSSSSAKASVPPSPSTLARLLLDVLPLRSGAFRALCLVYRRGAAAAQAEATWAYGYSTSLMSSAPMRWSRMFFQDMRLHPLRLVSL